jgi:hypothetical protein
MTLGEVNTTINAESGDILRSGRAHHALLAEVAQALDEGVAGNQLLVRIQPHFSGTDLAALVPAIRAADQAYSEAISRDMDRMIRDFEQRRTPANKREESDDSRERPLKPTSCIDPEASPEARFSALVYQLLNLMRETPPSESLLRLWNLWDQPDPFAHFIRNYCDSESPADVAFLIRTQQSVADQALELKLTLLTDTLCGIVERRLANAAARLAARFDGNMPGADIARRISDHKTGNPADTLQLQSALGGDRWQLACDGNTTEISEADCEALAVALDELLNQQPRLQGDRLAADFDACLTALAHLDDRSFQQFLREMQSVTLELMLSGLSEDGPRPASFDDSHPFYCKCACNLTKAAWAMMEYDVIARGTAPLDVFELTEILGVLTNLTNVLPNLFKKKTSSIFQKVLGANKGHPALYALTFPELCITPTIALTERLPREATLVIGETRWNANVDELGLLSCQFKHRNILGAANDVRFAEAWASDWLSDLLTQHPIRVRRFLRPFTRREADLLRGTIPRNEHWEKIAQLILGHSIFAASYRNF